MKLWPAESPNDATVGGFIVEFDSGIRKSVAWRSKAPIEPTIDASKQYVAELINALLAGRHLHEVEGTNWASAVAAVQKILADWNATTRKTLYAQPIDARTH